MTEPAGRGGLIESARALAITLLAIASTRLELLSAEVEEEKVRLGEILAFAFAAFFFLGFGSVLLALLLTVLLWDTHRTLALSAFTAIFLVGGVLTARAALGRVRAGSSLFKASIAELKRDRESLRGGQ